jgi:hypothetical protein
VRPLDDFMGGRDGSGRSENLSESGTRFNAGGACPSPPCGPARRLPARTAYALHDGAALAPMVHEIDALATCLAAPRFKKPVTIRERHATGGPQSLLNPLRFWRV